MANGEEQREDTNPLANLAQILGLSGVLGGVGSVVSDIGSGAGNLFGSTPAAAGPSVALGSSVPSSLNAPNLANTVPSLSSARLIDPSFDLSSTVPFSLDASASTTPTPAAASTGGSFGLSGLFSSLAPVAAAPLAIATAQNTISGVGNLFSGDDLSFGEEAALALPTFGASFLADPARDAFGSGKDPNQQQRDRFRNEFERIGFAKPGEGADVRDVTLADGSTFDIGHGNPIDFSDPAAADTVALTDVIAVTLGARDDAARSNISQLLAPAALSNAGGDVAAARNNILAFARDLGITRDQVRNALGGLEDPNRREVGLGALETLIQASG